MESPLIVHRMHMGMDMETIKAMAIITMMKITAEKSGGKNLNLPNEKA